jgi:hypothetical protein
MRYQPTYSRAVFVCSGIYQRLGFRDLTEVREYVADATGDAAEEPRFFERMFSLGFIMVYPLSIYYIYVYLFICLFIYYAV